MDGPAPVPADRVAQSWTSGAKDAVTTSLTGTVWATVGQGILNEIYWPSVDQPQIRDLGFLVAGAPGWRELKRVGRYAVSTPDPAVPLPTMVHTGDFYELALTVIPHPDNDALLISYHLTPAQGGAGQPVRLHPLLAPHLGRSTVIDQGQWPWIGADNSAWVDEDNALCARDGAAERWVCLLGAPRFTRGSAGYVGSSDGWTDLTLHSGRMTWTYRSAGPGTIALMGELVAPEGELSGTLALGFGTSAATARAAAAASLSPGIPPVMRTVTRQWTTWAATLTLPGTADGLSADLATAVRQSAAVLRVNQDRRTPGAFVAGLAIPWGDVTNDPGGYHMVWCRDAVETGFALAALGETGAAAGLVEFLAAHQQPDRDHPEAGFWPRCLFVDGTPVPGDVQLDEVAFPVLLAARLTELGVPLPSGTDLIRRAGAYLARHGPVTGVDRWEEAPGGSPFTIGLEITALLVAAGLASGAERDYLLSLADNWNERLEQFTYVAGGVLDRAFGTDGHYVRIGGPTDRVGLSNQPGGGEPVPSEVMVGLDFLYLVRLGLRDPSDRRITDTLRIVEAMISRDTPSGRTYYRYDLDGYGEWIDGSGWPVRHFGIGRPWPLLAGEHGHHTALAGGDPRAELEAMLRMRGRGGLLPEQVWDTDPLPWRNLEIGHPSGSAMPLAWAHSELIKLALTATTGRGRPVERLAVVEERYPRGAVPQTDVWRWRSCAPVHELPGGCTLVVEDTRPFTLHLGYDDWKPTTVTELPAQPLPLGMFGVTLDRGTLAGHTSLQFVRRYADGTWDPRDSEVTLGAERHPVALRLPLGERGAVMAAGPRRSAAAPSGGGPRVRGSRARG